MTAHHVAISTDAAYVRHAAATALSVLDHDPGTTVHLLHAVDVRPRDLDRFVRMAAEAGGRAELHAVTPEQVSGLAVVDRFGSAMWYRILLPRLLPGVARVLYLDADILVVASLRELFAQPLGTPVAAVHNVLEPRHRDRVAGLGIDGLRGYFNSGVLLLDLERLRRDGGMEQVVRVARARRDELVWPDQDALNLVFAHDREALHPRWNVQNSLFTWRRWADEVFDADVVDEALRAPAILHFEGPGQKPWLRECPHPRAEEYRRLAARTPWGPLRLRPARAPAGVRGRVRRLRRWADRVRHRWTARPTVHRSPRGSVAALREGGI